MENTILRRKKQGRNGVAFIITKKSRNKIIDFRPTSGRLAYVRIEAAPFNLSIINVYTPTENAEKEMKDKIYEQLEQEIEKIPKEDLIMVVGDMNAKIGKEEYVEKVAGKYTIHENTNDNEMRLCKLAAKTNMVISSTVFKHPRRHKETWIAPDKRTSSQIDHIMVTKRKSSSVKNVRTYRGACVDTDHFMVIATIKQKIKNLTKNKKEANWNIDKFRNKNEREKYAEQVEKQIEEHENESTDIETKWNILKKCIWQAAKKEVGKKEKEKKREWFNNECKENVAAKNEARIKWIRTGKIQDREEYASKRRICKAVIKNNKRDWIQYQMEQIENERNRNTKMFFQKIGTQKKNTRVG